jgi:flagellar protein FlaG
MSVENMPIDIGNLRTANSPRVTEQLLNRDQSVKIDNSLSDSKVNKRSEVKDTSFTEQVLAQQKLEQEKNAQEQKAQNEKTVTKSEDVQQTLGLINQLIPLKNTNLIFEFDDISEPPIIKVVDKSNDEVIREIPPQDLQKIADALNQMADNLSNTGALFNSKV